MNFALVSYARVSHGSAKATVERLAAAFKLERSSNLSEMVFYLSANPQEFLNLAFFWQAPNPQELENLFGLGNSAHPFDSCQLVDQQLYQLLWEYRSVGHYWTPLASAFKNLLAACNL